MQEMNRRSLDCVPNFITKEDWEASPDNYGLPPMVFNVINSPFDDDLTYVDLMLYMQQFLKTKNKVYVEIGVSVLKTFYQMARFLKDCSLYAYDINDINPTVENLFEKVNTGSKPKDYLYNTIEVHYFKGDVYKESDFDELVKKMDKKTNIIFSDACHRPDALVTASKFFIRKVLDDDFILYYDDLGDQDMQAAFFNIAESILGERGMSRKNHVALLKVNGWLGQHDVVGKHVNGIVTSLELDEVWGHLMKPKLDQVQVFQ